MFIPVFVIVEHENVYQKCNCLLVGYVQCLSAKKSSRADVTYYPVRKRPWTVWLNSLLNLLKTDKDWSCNWTLPKMLLTSPNYLVIIFVMGYRYFYNFLAVIAETRLIFLFFSVRSQWSLYYIQAMNTNMCWWPIKVTINSVGEYKNLQSSENI